MIKLQILSDTHNSDYKLSSEADIIIHAGDFSNGLKGVHQFINKCTGMNKDFIFCLGNHDYYGDDFDAVNSYFLEHYPDNYLTYNNHIIKQGKTFVGGTLFTNFRSNKQTEEQVNINKNKARQFVNDFYVIKYKGNVITPEDYSKLFKLYYDNIMQFKNKEGVIVVTHFPMHISCLDPKWDNPRDGILNPYFINDLNIAGFETIISGHTHTHFNHEINGCRIIINPLGYPMEYTGYKELFILEV